MDVNVPGSKSLAARALICASLAGGASRLTNVPEADDTRELLGALRDLGQGYRRPEDSPGTVLMETRGPPRRDAIVDTGNGGTTLRFLIPFAALGEAIIAFRCAERMRQRPVGGLVDALRELGADIRYSPENSFPLLVVRGKGLNGGRVRVSGSESSQFASALLLASPYARGPVELDIEGAVSEPYIAMTRDVMAAFAGPDGRYQPREYAVEADAAAAGYFFALAAITGRRARVRGIGASCRQPEIALVRDLERMGCTVSAGADATEVAGPAKLSGIDADMNGHPDSVPALAVAALFARGRTRIRNVRHLRYKESDRLAALASELGKLGARVVEHADGLEIEPPATVRGAAIDPHDDHRIAMAFGIVPGVTVENPSCVTKSFPGFWQDLKRVRAQ